MRCLQSCVCSIYLTAQKKGPKKTNRRVLLHWKELPRLLLTGYLICPPKKLSDTVLHSGNRLHPLQSSLFIFLVQTGRWNTRSWRRTAHRFESIFDDGAMTPFITHCSHVVSSRCNDAVISMFLTGGSNEASNFKLQEDTKYSNSTTQLPLNIFKF